MLRWSRKKEALSFLSPWMWWVDYIFNDSSLEMPIWPIYAIFSTYEDGVNLTWQYLISCTLFLLTHLWPWIWLTRTMLCKTRQFLVQLLNHKQKWRQRRYDLNTPSSEQTFHKSSNLTWKAHKQESNYIC